MTQTWDGTAADVCPLDGSEPDARPTGGRCGCCNGDGYLLGAWKGPPGGYWYWLCARCDGTGVRRRYHSFAEPVRYESAAAAFRAIRDIRGLR